jgi:hypothetical protein
VASLSIGMFFLAGVFILQSVESPKVALEAAK